MSNPTQIKKFNLLKLKVKTTNQLKDKIVKKWIKDHTMDENPNIIRYMVVGYSVDKDCKNISHGALVVYTNDGHMYIFEYGDLTAVNDDTILQHHKHPTKSWFVCILRDQPVNKNEKITIKKILLHAELWKQEMPYSWNYKSYPNNCYGYVDSVIVSVFNDKQISKNAIRW